MTQPILNLETDSSTPTSERIYQIATHYFARYGYYGTSARDIAREIGVSVATLYYHIQSKDALYRQVFQRQYIEEYELVTGIICQAGEEVVDDPKALRELIFNLIDALIDRSIKNPDIVRLWTRRWLEKPEQTEDIESAFSVPLYQLCEELLLKAQARGVIHPDANDLQFLIHSVTWLHYGYCGFGRLSYEARFKNPDDPQSMSQFQEFMHSFVSSMLQFSDQINTRECG